MIFSYEKWNSGRELQQVIKCSSAVEYNSFETVLREAFDLFIRPLLGEAMTAKLIELYNAGNADHAQLIYLAQRANANLAMWYNFYELTVIVSGSGIEKGEAGDYKGLYKYQERQLRDNYKTKGFNALDDLIVYLENSAIEEFKNSPAYLSRKKEIVPDADTVNHFLPIDRSRLVFLRMKPHLSFVEKTRLPSLISSALLLDLKNKIDKNDLTEKRYIDLMVCLQPVIILLAAARLVRQSGTLSDKGLYFSSVLAGISGNDETNTIASKEQVEFAAKQYESDAESYLQLTDQLIREQFPEMYSGQASDALNYDNDNSKIFWA